ncbi:MAG: hypothetical protein HND57_10805 [Planctomycetes bacterium]|nr:hypothetical protein [Planctomycetota bacterium]
MASTLTKLLIHITFSTKNRAQLILPEVEHDLYAYVGGICRNAHSPLLAIGGTADHIHLLVKLGKTTAALGPAAGHQTRFGTMGQREPIVRKAVALATRVFCILNRSVRRHGFAYIHCESEGTS